MTDTLTGELPLLCATPAGWAELAARSLPTFLADHAVCEQQAALTALNLVAHYPQDDELVQRMTSLAASHSPLPDVRGLIFFGFPLHAPWKDSSHRADHLKLVKIPLLFLQGTRDKLANLELLRPVCKNLGRRARLSVVDGGDHSLRVPRRSGRTDDEVLDEVAGTVETWAARLP